MLLHEKLRESQPEEEVRTIARVRTLTVLPRLDGKRKRSVLQFLHESGVIKQGKSDLNLRGADLKRADLIGVNLNGANLTGAFLGGAVPWGADLIGVNLTGTNLNVTTLIGADLTGADLTGATLRDGNGIKIVELEKQTSTKRRNHA